MQRAAGAGARGRLLGAGRHAVNLAEGRRVATGLYWVRLAQGANQRTTRVAVIEQPLQDNGSYPRRNESQGRRLCGN